MRDPSTEDCLAILDALVPADEGRLTPADVDRLRRVLAPFHSMASTMRIDQLVETGYFLVGLYAPPEWDNAVPA